MPDQGIIHTSDDGETLDFVLEVQNKMGIHARPSAKIAGICHNHDAEVTVRKYDDPSDTSAESLMGLMMLAAAQGEMLHFTARGPEARIVYEQLKALFDSKFAEAYEE